MTFIAEGLSLRVNGQDCDTIYLRPALVDGVFTDPEVLLLRLGAALNDDSVIEISEDGRQWRRVSIIYLTTLLQARP